MRAVTGLVLLSFALSCGCAPKVDATGDTTGATTTPEPKKKPKHEKLPADAVLWQGELDYVIESSQLQEKEGLLVRTKEPEETARYWPFSMDYWGVARTDLEELLAPHVGRKIRIRGHFKKTYDDAVWFYEVEPVKITAVADEPAK